MNDKPHIGIFGRVNVGKSTLMNALAGQNVSIVSPVAGTTTDAVKKPAEILGAGAVVLLDTAGLDDITLVGEERVKRTLAALDIVDAAILVFDGDSFGNAERRLADKFKEKNIPFFLVNSKVDTTKYEALPFLAPSSGLKEIIEKIKTLLAPRADKNLFDGLISQDDTVILVMPQDGAAPKGRLILPQVQAVRAALDLGATAVCSDGKNLSELVKKYAPALVVTDSQVFDFVSAQVPQEIPLTSFSILLARVKGDFELMLSGTKKISGLRDGDKILILESCTHTAHHCDDIGRKKIPSLLQKKTGKKLNFTFVSGLDALPEDLKSFALSVQCGGCMITKTQLLNRIYAAQKAGVAITNYGMLIAECTGILERTAPHRI